MGLADDCCSASGRAWPPGCRAGCAGFHGPWGSSFQQAGDVRDPGAVADLPVAVIGRRPGGRGNLADRGLDVLGDRHADGVVQPPGLRGEPVQKLVRPAAGAGPDQHLAPQARGSWASASRAASMWSAAVLEPAFPGRSTMASGSPIPSAPWSAQAVIGWKAVGLLPGGRGLLLVRVRDPIHHRYRAHSHQACLPAPKETPSRSTGTRRRQAWSAASPTPGRTSDRCEVIRSELQGIREPALGSAVKARRVVSRGAGRDADDSL
jgi:hypothetical protein